jgi:hypothetical protein
VQAEVAAGRLTRDISSDIDAEITMNPVAGSPGQFEAAPSGRFFSLSLMLADAFFRSNQAAPGVSSDLGLAYMRWNMGPARFGTFLTSAEAHRQEPAYDLPGGAHPSVAEWAFHRTIKAGEYDQPRRNALRLTYFSEVYRLIYEGFTP